MESIPYSALPFAVRLATMAAYFMGWVLFAELVIDRHGLARYLPLYRIGNFCPYDLAVLAVLTVWWWTLHRS